MPRNPEAQQSPYLTALCRVLRDPEDFIRNSGEFFEYIEPRLRNHLLNEAPTRTELDRDLIFDKTYDRFMHRLRDQRPEHAARIWTLAPKLLPPPKRGSAYSSDVKSWANDTSDWTAKEILFCDGEEICEKEIRKINKEMEPLCLRGDDLLEWIGWSKEELEKASSSDADIDADEDDGDEPAAKASKRSARSRREKIAKRAKAIGSLFITQGKLAADTEIGMEHGAVFALEMDEIIRSMPIVKLPMESFIERIGSNLVIDAIRELDRYYIEELDKNWQNGEDEKVSIADRHENLQTPAIHDYPEIPKGVYSQLEFEQILKSWGANIEKSDGLKYNQRYEDNAKWKADREMLKKTLENLLEAPVEEEAKSDRYEQIKGCIIAPQHEAQATFNRLQKDYQDYEALEEKSEHKLANLKKARDAAKKELEEHKLNELVLETMLDGFKKAAESQTALGVAEQFLIKKLEKFISKASEAQNARDVAKKPFIEKSEKNGLSDQVLEDISEEFKQALASQKSPKEAEEILSKKFAKRELDSDVIDAWKDAYREAKSKAQDDPGIYSFNPKGYTQDEIAKTLGLENRQAIRDSKERIARLLAPIAPKKLRNRLINSQWKYLNSIKQETGYPMPRLPKNFDADEWIDVMRWSVNMLEKQKQAASVEQNQAKGKLRYLDDKLVDLCRDHQPDSFNQEKLEELLKTPSDETAAQISQR